MNYSFWDFLELLGSLGIFIFGMKIMSEGLQNAAGNGLRKILKGMTSTRMAGVFTGFAITCAVQSSSATTVMVVSFVNAGLLTLSESLGVIMGANIGTTITAWIISIFGFNVKIVSVAIILTGIAFPFLFSKRNQLKYMAEFILGFSILFIGLNFLKEAVPNVKDNPEIFEFLQHYTHLGFGSTLLFVLIGTILTVVVQSSSASTAITLVMLAEGWIGFPMAAAMVLGENIGTTITANIAAFIANVQAKRAARFHAIFNIVGVIWMLALMPYFLKLVDYLVSNFFTDNLTVFDLDETSRIGAGTIGLALFHSLFNITNVVLMIGFVPMLEKLVIKLQPSKATDEEFHLEYISTGLLSTPGLSVEEAKKEVQVFAKILDKLCLNIMALFFEKVKNYDKLREKIKKREDITDKLEVEISNYLSKATERDMSRATAQKIRSILRMINDMERIGDVFFQLMINGDKMKQYNIKFSEEVKQELDKMLNLIYDGIKQMRKNLTLEVIDKKFLKTIYTQENKINNLRDKLQKAHYKRLEETKTTIQEGIIYLDIVNSLEKIGDYLVNINEAIAGLK